MSVKKGTVLVTGGTKRIGKAICDVLSKRGWNVLVHSRNPESPLCADFQDLSSAESLFARALEIAPDLCAIVNNAAVFSPKSHLNDADSAHISLVNYEVPERLTECLYEHLVATKGRGSVVNLIDSRILGGKASTPYEVSKNKLYNETLASAHEYAPYLRINAVAPGPVLPPPDKENSEKGADIILDARPLPEDVAEAAAYLLEAKSVTGQVIAVDSGSHFF